MKKLLLPFLLILLISCQQEPKVVKRSGEPDVIKIEGDDRKMNEAISKANHTLPQFDQALANKKSNVVGLSLKARFNTPNGGGEHIWMTDVTIRNKHYYGVVGNLPESTTEVKLGDTVLIPNENISDWMYIEDGKLRGGFTIRVLRDKLSDADKKVFDQENGLVIED